MADDNGGYFGAGGNGRKFLDRFNPTIDPSGFAIRTAGNAILPGLGSLIGWGRDKINNRRFDRNRAEFDQGQHARTNEYTANIDAMPIGGALGQFGQSQPNQNAGLMPFTQYQNPTGGMSGITSPYQPNPNARPETNSEGGNPWLESGGITSELTNAANQPRSSQGPSGPTPIMANTVANISGGGERDSFTGHGGTTDIGSVMASLQGAQFATSQGMTNPSRRQDIGDNASRKNIRAMLAANPNDPKALAWKQQLQDSSVGTK